MGLDQDAATLAAHCERVLPLATAALGDEYSYQSLPLCVIDAVFSINMKYPVVQRVVARYCAHTGQRRVRAGVDLPPREQQESISSFCDRPEQSDTATMAVQVYRSRNLTSPRSGILKSEAALRFARCLRSHRVEHLQDVPAAADNRRLEADIKAIPGQRSGLSLEYFWMLAGSEQFVKADRMVLRFMCAALSRPVVAGEALPLLRVASSQLAARHTGMTPRLLDHAVWNYQRAAKSAETGVAADAAACRLSTTM